MGDIQENRALRQFDHTIMAGTYQRYCINSGSLEFTPTGDALRDKLGRGAPEGLIL